MKLGFIDIVLFYVRLKFSLPENLMKKHWGVASGGASDILRAGRATLFEQGERHPSSRASGTLPAGRVTRFERGE